jgi:hypothetical protein
MLFALLSAAGATGGPSGYPPPVAPDQTPLLLLVIAGFAALVVYLNNQKNNNNQQQQAFAQQAPALAAASAPSSDVRALQDTVRLLVEQQQRAQFQQQMQPQQPQQPAWTDYTQQQQQRRGRGQSRTGGHNGAPASSSLQRAPSSSFSYNDGGDESPADPSAHLPLSPTFQSTMALGNASGIPVELLNDLRVLSDSVKNLERKNRELNRQLTLTEVSNVVDLSTKYKM